jgi:uncharacterized protein (TIGR02147 family)
MVYRQIYPMKNRFQISIFDYTDYRKFLLDYYQAQKSVNPAFSYRFFARKAGTSSVGLYKDVVEGRLALGRVLTARFSKALGLTKKEAEYFENMVCFNEATTIEEKRGFFERMIAACQPHDRTIEIDQYEYYTRWYYGAVRNLLLIVRWKDDYSALAAMLEPAIRPEEARKAIEVLERLHFIRREDDGCYTVADATITTGRLTNNTSVQVMNVMHFQRIMNDMGKEALDRFPLHELGMSTLTIAVSEKTFLTIKEDIAALRQRVKVLAERDECPDRIFQLNYQLFPLSKKVVARQPGEET